jgi:hypothetical protein
VGLGSSRELGARAPTGDFARDCMMTFTKRPSSRQAADRITRQFFGVGDDAALTRPAVRRLLLGALEVAILIPVLLGLRFGQVGDIGWGLTVFFVVYCLLAAVGLQFRSKAEYHTPRLRGAIGWTGSVPSGLSVVHLGRSLAG